MEKYKELRRECYEANQLLPKLGLVLFSFGNVSAFDREAGVFAIKPVGVDYAAMQWEDIVVVDLDNQVVEGRLDPAPDARIHSVLYKSFPGIGGIVHTHSTYAVAWAQAQRDVPLYGTTHANHLAVPIPCTEIMADERIAGDYETETGYQIVDCLMARDLNYQNVPMILVAGHGPFTWGDYAANAVYNAKVLEKLCRMAAITEQLNSATPPLKAALVNRHYNRRHGRRTSFGQN
ncbi:MAG: L-ribulose-5-phosphate 4-epimerase AraD [Victivallales bacterium]|nr:L-ribulose-5-phosphate 4-epimerase AraD [Victivallales bacterium]